MAEHYSARWKQEWAGVNGKLEDAFQLPKSRSGRLVRPRFPRKLAGVCSGLAEYFGWEVTLLRVLAIVLTVASTGLMVVAYAAAWVLIPEGQYALRQGDPRQGEVPAS